MVTASTDKGLGSEGGTSLGPRAEQGSVRASAGEGCERSGMGTHQGHGVRPPRTQVPARDSGIGHQGHRLQPWRCHPGIFTDPGPSPGPCSGQWQHRHPQQGSRLGGGVRAELRLPRLRPGNSEFPECPSGHRGQEQPPFPANLRSPTQAEVLLREWPATCMAYPHHTVTLELGLAISTRQVLECHPSTLHWGGPQKWVHPATTRMPRGPWSSAAARGVAGNRAGIPQACGADRGAPAWRRPPDLSSGTAPACHPEPPCSPPGPPYTGS